MRDLWYSDNRDVAKWGVLFHLARSYSLRTIVQVPYWRPESDRPHFVFRKRRIAVGRDVWGFFRNVKHAERLGQAGGTSVRVVTAAFSHQKRTQYLNTVQGYLGRVRRPMLLFLDPDTGLEPKTAKETHTTKAEVERLWQELRENEWLVLYQHARHNREWISSVSAQLTSLCSGGRVEVARSEKVGSDVAFLCVKKRAG